MVLAEHLLVPPPIPPGRPRRAFSQMSSAWFAQGEALENRTESSTYEPLQRSAWKRKAATVLSRSPWV